ncbi:MAG TPA: hypothetical protein VGR21_08085 [Cryptosporangiaceae bacterium]|nr:hypothetical protein [Cryptosporangiaceae bacterium]
MPGRGILDGMGAVQPLPHRGDTFVDSRNGSRMLRVSGHPDAGTVVLSVWDHDRCRASFRLPASEVDELVRALLTAAPPAPPETRPVLTVPPVPEPTEPPDAADDDAPAPPGTS